MAPKRKVKTTSSGEKPPKKAKIAATTAESTTKEKKRALSKAKSQNTTTKITDFLTTGKSPRGESASTAPKTPKKKKETSNTESPIKENKPETSVEDSPEKGENSTSSHYKVLSWNISGVRAWLKKDGLNIIREESPDVVCLQETKCSLVKMPEEIKSLKGYQTYFAAAKKEGYSGVGLLSKIKPVSVVIGIGDATQDEEGRCITAEYDKFYVVNAYVPNSGKKLVTLGKRMDWEKKMTEYLCDLDNKKPVIYCGDLNVSHKAIDLANPKNNVKNAGYTIEERTCFSELLDKGFIDSYRHLYPDKEKQYTFWTYMMNCRAKNIGWRLDYFVLSKALINKLEDNIIHSKVMGSDHCPITLLLTKD